MPIIIPDSNCAPATNLYNQFKEIMRLALLKSQLEQNGAKLVVDCYHVFLLMFGSKVVIFEEFCYLLKYFLIDASVELTHCSIFCNVFFSSFLL